MCVPLPSLFCLSKPEAGPQGVNSLVPTRLSLSETATLSLLRDSGSHVLGSHLQGFPKLSLVRSLLHHLLHHLQMHSPSETVRAQIASYFTYSAALPRYSTVDAQTGTGGPGAVASPWRALRPSNTGDGCQKLLNCLLGPASATTRTCMISFALYMPFDVLSTREQWTSSLCQFSGLSVRHRQILPVTPSSQLRSSIACCSQIHL